MRLKGKTALIVGGGEGISKATALLFCKEGARVGITGRTKKKLDEDFIGNPPDAQKQLDDIAAQIVPVGKRGEPNDIAYSVLYLSCDESKYVTGSSLVVDGVGPLIRLILACAQKQLLADKIVWRIAMHRA